jgi:hypothetical protein
MHFTRRLKRFAVVAAVGGLLLNAAAPMLANAAAALAGVPTGEICDVYGVRFPEAPPVPHLHDAAMHEADDADDVADETTADVAASAEAPASDAHHGADHHHAPGLHAGGHCALTALATFALPAPGGLAPRPPTRAIHHASLDGAQRAAFDAAADWALSSKTGPPATA